MMRSGLFLIPVLFIGAPAYRLAQSDEMIRPFSCEAFGADVSAVELTQRFGASNVASAEIHIGEGESATGTVVFPTRPLDRVEILWKNKKDSRRPDSVRVSGDRTHWRTAQGITLSTRLNTVRSINGRVFDVMNFDRDYAGTVLSWNGGFLARTEPSCTFAVAFTFKQSPRSQAAARKLKGGSYSSDLAAMRELNPRIYSMHLAYR
jgi:hypothetical protein